MSTAPQDIPPGSIAIIGMAGRFPAAATTAALWRLLREGREATRWFTDDELLAAGVSAAALRDPNYVRAGMVLPDMECFDAGFFGFSPREAAILDPQHRHFLECAWEALEDAGHMPERFDGAVGVFAGSGMQAYLPYNLLSNPELVQQVGLFLLRHTGNDKDFLTTRLSYLLNLQGPSVNVQTACSTSLVAVHLAAQSLLSGECDMALAGGVTIELPHRHGYRYVEQEILSPDGHCRAFDDDSKGTVFGSGVGVVVLRRLEDALAAGDHIHAVIRGSAINNDGSQKAGYLAPSVEGQARAAAEALAVAGVEPETVSYIEAHGTGTPVGDPIELAALAEAYGGSGRRQFCRIGSIKTNIGHLDTAAGVASLIKVAMAMRLGELPPSLNCATPNRRFDFAASPFRVHTALQSWPRQPGAPRRAAVNSLGVGGTNAHVVLEEAPASAAAPAGRQWQLLPLSARSAESLQALRQKWAAFMAEAPADFPLQDAAFTLQEGRREFSHRCAIVAEDRASLIEALEQAPAKRLPQGIAAPQRPEVVFMFPGGGAQYPGMGRDLHAREPAFRAAMEECFRLMPADAPADLRKVMLESDSTDAAAALVLEQPRYAIPALFVAEYATARMWESWGIRPDALIGHSAGEYAAACLAGVISLADALAIVVLRGQIFESVPEGAMLAVSLPEAALAARLPDGLDIAAANAPELSVATGPVAAIAELEAALQAEDIECRRLRINVAAHSRMLDPALPRFRERLQQVAFAPPSIPFVSCSTGAVVAADTLTNAEYWVRHLRQMVRFAAGMQTVLQTPNRILLECGPGQTLASLARINAASSEARPLALLPSMRQAQEEDSDLAFALGTAGRIWSLGHPLQWPALRGTGAARRMPLPTYAFDKQRHWIEPGKAIAAADGAETAQAAGGLRRLPDIADWFQQVTWEQTALPPAPPQPGGTWLLFDDASPLAAALSGLLRQRGAIVVTVRPGPGFSLEGHGAVLDPADPAQYQELVAALDSRGLLPQQMLHLWSRLGEAGSLTLGFDSAMLLCQAMALQAVDGVRRCMLVTSGSQSLPGEAAAHPERAAMLGPCRVAPRELPGLSMQLVDVQGAAPALAEALLAEVDAATADDLVALRDGARWTQRLRPAGAGGSLPSRLRQGGAYLLTGGLGGIGLCLAAYLAAEAKARLALLVRRTPPPRDQWEAVLQGRQAGDAALLRQLLAIEQAGGELLLLPADLADAASVERAVAQAQAHYGAIHGVFHMAGTMQDGPLATKTLAEAHQVLAPKLQGGLLLHRLLPPGSLDLFAVFSSTSVLLGPPGQADYVGANAFLDALAAARPDGLSIAWGIWADRGMAVRSYATPQPAEDQEGHLLIGREISRSRTELVFEAKLDPLRLWVLADHVVGGRPVLPGAAYVEMARAAAAALPDAAPTGLGITALSILAPLSFAPGEQRRVRTCLQRGDAGDYSFTVSSSDAGAEQWQEHARARLVPQQGGSLPAEALAAKAAATSAGQPLGVPQPGAVQFGPRWDNIRWVAPADGQVVAEFALPESFQADLQALPVHPALLDLAATIGLHLLPAEAVVPGRIYAPISVQRLRLTGRPWPRELRSCVRLKTLRPGAYASFDGVITDLAGQVLCGFEELSLASVAQQSLGQSAGAPATGLQALLQNGIRGEDAPALFARLLSGDGRHMVASSMPIIELRQAMAPPPRRKEPRRADAGAAPASYANSVEAAIAGYWTELLGVEVVKPEDDFFSLGGFSLVAVRLFARIRKDYGVDLPLATLFEAPTLRQLASLVMARAGLDAASVALAAPDSGSPAPAITGPAQILPFPVERFSPLVTISRGVPGRTPFFCVHGGGGNVLNFSGISRAMGRDQPFYGLQAQGVDGNLPPLESVEEMAASYIEALRTVSRTGPYCLAGYSGGGVVAFEMAQQLRRGGHEIAMLVMFDTLSPLAARGRRNPLQRLWAARHWSLKFALEWPKRRAWLHGHLQRLAEMRRQMTPDRLVPKEFLDLYLMDSYLKAQSAYQPQAYDGDLILFRAREAALDYLVAGKELGWQSVVQGSITVHDLDANHESMMTEPAIGILAQLLRQRLDALATPMAAAGA